LHGDKPKPGAGFFPLTVDYREYTYAAERFRAASSNARAPSEKEILTSRLIDRPIRPLFPEGFLNETQIIAMVLSADPSRIRTRLAIVGAAARAGDLRYPFPYVWRACAWACGRRVRRQPDLHRGRESKLNIVVAGTEEGIVMVEAGAQQVSEAEVLGAIEFGHASCKKIAAAIRELMKAVGKPKRVFTPPALDQALYDKISQQLAKS
jgi:polyribonucleotide nucleotidyltransferase